MSNSKLKKIIPLLGWLPNYKKEYILGDISAGITVGVMLIPQGMAYAILAGLPPVYGLYASLIPLIIYAFLGTSRQLAVGPVAMDSLLIASGLGALSITGIENYVAMAIFLAFFIGGLQLLLGFCKMGFLVNFLSKPVISGFISAAAIIISLSQFEHLLGIEISGSIVQHQIGTLFQNIGDINYYTLAIGLTGILIIKLLKKWNPAIPSALIVVVLGIVLLYFTKWNEEGVKIIASIPEGLPSFQIPNFSIENTLSLFPIALTVAFVGFMEAISIGKAMEEKHKYYEIDANQELIALGSANMLGSFFQAFPVAASFSRSAVNNQSGAKTGVAMLISAILVGATLLFLTPIFYYLPNAVLAAIIIAAVVNLIDIKYPIALYKHRKDEFFVLIITFIITLLIGIKEGILVGILFSLLLIVYRISKPHFVALGRIKGTEYYKNKDRFNDAIEIRDDLLIVRFDGLLFFGNKDYFKNELLKKIAQEQASLKTIIINAEAINYIDSTALQSLIQIIQDLKNKNYSVIITNAIGPARDIIFRSDLIKVLGKENLYVSIADAVHTIDNNMECDLLLKKMAHQSK